MLENQKEKFNLPDDVIYFNTSYMSPSLKEVEKAGVNAVKQKNTPYSILPKDFFNPVTELKKLYASLIDVSDYNRIACIPSVSYGIATVTNNITLSPGDEIIVVEDQFPSNYYAWEKLAAKHEASIVTIKKPIEGANIEDQWNQEILNAINENTVVVAIANVHWADGTLFDLAAIRKKTNLYNALLVIDGTQSVGALPFSVEKIKPDALICATYKWLLGPYSFGLAYYGNYFDNGIPIEESWSNRLNSEDFSGLTKYESRYKEKANRYCMGESANFISTPMATKAIQQIIEWSPERIQEYCHDISHEALKELEGLGFRIANQKNRGNHLVGVKIPDNININDLKEKLSQKNIYLSYRGNYMRIAIHLFNTKSDFDRLLKQIKMIIH